MVTRIRQQSASTDLTLAWRELAIRLERALDAGDDQVDRLIARRELAARLTDGVAADANPIDFTVARDGLHTGIARVVGASTQVSEVPIYANIRLRVRTDATLQLACTDGLMELQTQCSAARVGTPGVITVPARKLAEIVERAGSPFLRLLSSSTEHQRMAIVGPHCAYQLRTLPAAEFGSDIPTEKPLATIDVAAGDLRRCVEEAAVAMDRRGRHGPHGCMLLEVDGDTLRCVATDEHRLAVSRCAATAPAGCHTQAIVAARHADLLMDALANAEPAAHATLAIAANSMEMRACNRTARLRCIPDSYPRYTAAIPGPLTCEMQLSREALLGAAKRAQILAPDPAATVTLIATADSCTVQAVDRVGGDPDSVILSEALDAQGRCWPTPIALDIHPLVDALAALTASEITLGVDKSGSALRIEAARDARSVHVLVLPHPA